LIIVMQKGATEPQVAHVVKRIEELGYRAHVSAGEDTNIIGVIGHNAIEAKDSLVHLPGVGQIIPITKPFKLSGREWHPEDSVYKVNGHQVGGGTLFVMAGPCAVESREQLLSTARAVKAAGATYLRGGAFKPRTSPYTFQGMGLHGLKLLEEARAATGLGVVTEVMTPQDVEAVAESADILQIGARNMQNYNLLYECGQVHKPVLLKRGLSATIQEWLLAAEYILSRGNYQVILCERGIRTFETITRNTLDLNAVPVLRELSHLPIVVDPSHGTGKWSWVTPMACAGVAAGADGLMIEVHPDPDAAYSDGPQSLTFANFEKLMTAVRAVAAAVGRELA
ncbi:MAG TPA: 3-deoxy-7-phosphoheptulonate synthase, partial [Candidatus Dormibacteraeota bacterium]|jgi:3-deoxy-7-phosphoheptulonate synthase|nr:3-deoxy-7-phosphoheptulonate synthase [Candidatus Dormibacteraeota bacterium]